MRTLHPVLAAMRTLAIASVLLVPSLAHGKGARLDVGVHETRVDSLVKAGCNVEAFSEGVNLLSECLSTYGASSVETMGALRSISSALVEWPDFELAASMWRLTWLAAAESLGPCHPVIAKAQFEYMLSARRVGRTELNVLSIAQDALSMLDPEDPEQRVLIGRIKLQLGVYYWRRDFPRSIETFEEALQLMEGTPDALLSCATRAWLGFTLLSMGRHDEARYHLERARDEIGLLEHADPANVANIEGSLGQLAAVSGDWLTAERHFGRAVEERAQKRMTGSSRFTEVGLPEYSGLALAELKRGRTEEAWHSLQVQRGVMDKRLRSLNQLAARSPKTYARVRSLRNRIDANRDLRRQWHEAQGLGEVNWPRVLDELDANAELFRLEAGYYSPEVIKTVSLRDFQSVLPDNYAYIGWLDCRFADAFLNSPGKILDSCWMYVVRSEGPVHWIPLWEDTTVTSQNDLRGPVGDYGKKMSRAAGWELRVEDDPSLKELARTIAAQEFDPALPFLDGVDCLVVEFFEERTAWKPVEALILPDGQYVGDRFRVAYTPTADAFVASRRSAKPTGKKVLVVGDPVFNPDDARAEQPILEWRDAGKASDVSPAVRRAATNGEPDALKSLPRLRYAKLETDHLHRVFPECTMLCGDEATEANVRRVLHRDASRFRIIHFATHSLAESSIRQRHALAMSQEGVDGSPMNDGLVDGLEMQLEWHLNADLVTLSGCRTLDGWGWSGGEPAGLAGIMLGAGARSVLATSWQVDDLAAARLNARFYENLTGHYLGNPDGRDGKPMTKAAALSEAKRWLRTFTDETGKKPFAHPVYWSGFILIGDPE